MEPAFKCLEIAQTLPVEAVFVDDCSTDETYEKLCEYCKSFKGNAKVVRNEKNQGPGLSRNHGIKEANGKYIMFLDSDDYFEKNFYDVVLPILEQDPDCVSFDYGEVFHNGKINYHSIYYATLPEGSIDPKKNAVFIRGATCGKIYKRSIILINNVQFLELKRNEDMPFTKVAASYCRKIYYTKQTHYMYYQHEQSLMHNSKLLDPMNTIKAFTAVHDNFNNGFQSEIEAIFVLECFYSTALINAERMGRKEWICYISNLEEMFPGFSDNKYIKDYSKSVQVVVMLAKRKMYFSVKSLYLLRNMIKSLKLRINRK